MLHCPSSEFAEMGHGSPSPPGDPMCVTRVGAGKKQPRLHRGQDGEARLRAVKPQVTAPLWGGGKEAGQGSPGLQEHHGQAGTLRLEALVPLAGPGGEKG